MNLGAVGLRAPSWDAWRRLRKWLDGLPKAATKSHLLVCLASVSLETLLFGGNQVPFLSEAEHANLRLERMIFHVVGKTLDDPVILEEIAPLQEEDFFLERVKTAAGGNLFAFREASETEQKLRSIRANPSLFADISAALARDFHGRHKSQMSDGALFLFDLSAGDDKRFFAIVKYDNEDVVKYSLETVGDRQRAVLERFAQSFVKKREAMQKVALIRLHDQGGDVAVYDRSNRMHISDYFEGFLRVRRVNEAAKNSEKLAEACKKTFIEHQRSLHQPIRDRGVSGMYDTLRQGHRFDPDNMEGFVTAVFGQQEENSPILRTLRRNLRNEGISEEAFEVVPDSIRKPSKRHIKTAEGVTISYDDTIRNLVQERPSLDGRTEIVITTNNVVERDIYVGARRN